MSTAQDDSVGAFGVRVADPGRLAGVRTRARRWAIRLSSGPFDVGHRDEQAFVARGTRRRKTLIDQWAGPMAFQIAGILLLLAAVGPATAGERAAGIAVIVAAATYGLVITMWGHRLPVVALDVTMPFAAVLLVVVGVWGGDLVLAVPTLAVVVATCIFAQRPWLAGFVMTCCLGVGYAVVLAATDASAPVSRWVIVMTAVVSSGAFVHWVRSKVVDFVEAEAAVRTRAEAAGAELADLSRAKTDFLGRMSHELRTPLNAVLGFTSILLDRKAGALTDLQAEYLGDVQAAGLHLRDLVGDVLDVAQVEAGQSDLELAPFAVGPTVDDCVRMVRERAARGGVTVTAEVDPSVPIVQADGRKVRQALLNLVANAVRFTPPGGSVTIRVTTAGGEVLVAVSDTGIGIAPEDQERMFDRFEQAADDDGGTGLGLAIARRFVAQHGGRLTVESAPGAGSTFTLALPARPPTEPVTERHLVAARPAAAEANSDLYEALMVRGSPSNRRMVAGLGRTLSLSSAAIAVLLALVTPGDALPRAAIAAIAGLAFVVMWALDRIPTSGSSSVDIDLVCLIGAAAISGLVHFSGDLADVTPVAYGWIICVAFAPWSGRQRLPELLYVGVGYAAVLAVDAGPGSELDRWLAVVGVFLINGFVIHSLVGKLQVMMFAEREARRTAEAVEEELAAATAHKDDFVASMSHELRTPLNAIIGFSEVVHSGTAGPLNADQQGYLEDVVAAGRQLLVLIDDILELAKLDAGRVPLQAEVIDLADLVVRTAADHRAAANERDITVHTSLPSGSVPVLVDPLLFEHAISRLVGKSVQSSPDGSAVTLSVERARGLVVLAVTDAAPRSLADREHMFDSADEWDEREGSGLALAIARRIAALHDGALVLRAAARGNRLELTLPAASAKLASAVGV